MVFTYDTSGQIAATEDYESSNIDASANKELTTYRGYRSTRKFASISIVSSECTS